MIIRTYCKAKQLIEQHVETKIYILEAELKWMLPKVLGPNLTLEAVNVAI